MCDIMVDACLYSCWFITAKIFEILNEVVFSNDDKDLDYIVPDIVTFVSDDMGIKTISLNVINLDDNSFNEDGHEIVIHVKLIAWCIKYRQRKASKKDLSKELMFLSWYATIWWDWCVSDDEKKEQNNFLWMSSGVKLLLLF